MTEAIKRILTPWSIHKTNWERNMLHLIVKWEVHYDIPQYGARHITFTLSDGSKQNFSETF